MDKKCSRRRKETEGARKMNQTDNITETIELLEKAKSHKSTMWMSYEVEEIIDQVLAKLREIDKNLQAFKSTKDENFLDLVIGKDKPETLAEKAARTGDRKENKNEMSI